MRDYNKLSNLFPYLDIDCLTKTVNYFDIHNDLEFIAQCAHESCGFKHFKENLNYSAKCLSRCWPKRFKDCTTNLPNDLAKSIEYQPQKIANIVYANRYGNGDETTSDGYKYCGRGCIQITFRDNYSLIEDTLIGYGICEYCGEITLNPELLETWPFCMYSAGAYWKAFNLDFINDFKQLTYKINGGYNGLEDRIYLLNKVKKLYETKQNSQ